MPSRGSRPGSESAYCHARANVETPENTELSHADVSHAEEKWILQQ